MSLLQMSFSGAIIILVIILLRALAINKLPKRIFILLWEVALIRLLIPFSIPSMLSAYSFVNKNTSIQEILTEISTDKIIPQVTTEQINFNISTIEYPMTSSSIWSIIWMVGVLLCAIFFIVSYLRCYFEFCTSLPVMVGCGTLYNLLEQFLEAKMICETKVEGRKRSYILTEKGKAMLEKEYARIQAQAQDYRAIFGEKGSK